jgi:drug/metabolite transporter (DMT)-like permease
MLVSNSNQTSHMTATQSMLRPRVLIPFLIVTLIWSSTWLVIRGQLGLVPVAWSVAYRFIIAATALFAYGLVTRQKLGIDKQGHIFAIAFGLMQFMFNLNFVYHAEGLITSGLVAVVFALLIVPNAVMGSLFLGQPITRRFLGGSVVAMAGVALLFVKELRVDGNAQTATLHGIAFTCLGVLSASVANVMQGTKQARAMAMTSLLGWGMVWGSLGNAVFAWMRVGPPVFDLHPTYLFGLAYLSVFASAIAFTLYFSVIRAVGPGKAAYSSVLTPIIAMLLSTVFEGYRWTLLAAGGGVLALIGLERFAFNLTHSQPL